MKDSKRIRLIYAMLWFDAKRHTKAYFKKEMLPSFLTFLEYAIDAFTSVYKMVAWVLICLILWPLYIIGKLIYWFTYKPWQLMYKPTNKAILTKNLERFEQTGDWR